MIVHKPEPLKKGATIGVVAPAGCIDEESLKAGTEAIRAFADGDSRFTFTGTLDLRLQKRFVVNGHALAAVLDAYNVINLGYEVEEFVVTGPTYRDISAIQPPRAVQVGLRVSF